MTGNDTHTHTHTNFLLTKASRKKNRSFHFKVFERDKFFHSFSPHKSKLCKHPTLVSRAALLLDNDYFPRMKNSGSTTVILGSLEKIKKEPLFLNQNTGCASEIS